MFANRVKGQIRPTDPGHRPCGAGSAETAHGVRRDGKADAKDRRERILLSDYSDPNRRQKFCTDPGTEQPAPGRSG